MILTTYSYNNADSSLSGSHPPHGAYSSETPIQERLFNWKVNGRLTWSTVESNNEPKNISVHNRNREEPEGGGTLYKYTRLSIYQTDLMIWWVCDYQYYLLNLIPNMAEILIWCKYKVFHSLKIESLFYNLLMPRVSRVSLAQFYIGLDLD